MKHPPPNPTGSSAPHWHAAGEGRLALAYCRSCRSFLWPVRSRCVRCGGAIEWRDAAACGRIAAFSVVRRAVNPDLERAVPYVVAFVELDAGVRIFTNVVDIEPAAVQVGLRVRCRFERALDQALFVPVFAPEPA